MAHSFWDVPFFVYFCHMKPEELIHNKVIGVEAEHAGIKQQHMGPVILATGHSARDVYRYFAQSGFNIEAKALAVGCRLEHPSQLIDSIQYHNRA